MERRPRAFLLQELKMRPKGFLTRSRGREPGDHDTVQRA
jgi:hypothetical protein